MAQRTIVSVRGLRNRVAFFRFYPRRAVNVGDHALVWSQPCIDPGSAPRRAA
jgi:hypothetical protein